MWERWRSGWRRIVLITTGTILTLILVLVGAWESGVLNGPALWLVGEVSGYRISCGQLDGGLLSHFTCRDLKLADQHGVFLTAKRLELDWNGGAIIGNKAEIHSLTLDGARLTRLPKSKAKSSSSALPSTQINIGHLNINHFVLATAHRPKACIGLHGAAMLGPQGFRANLDLATCQADGGHLVARGHYVKATGALALKATGRGNGAILDQLFGLKTAGAPQVAINISGTLHALNGFLHLSAAHVGRLDADLRANGPAQTRIDGRFHIAPALLPSFAPRAPGTIAAEVSYGTKGSFSVNQLRLDWGGLSAKGDLSVAANHDLTGHLALSSGTTLNIAGTSIGGLAAAIALSGQEHAPKITGRATFDHVARGPSKIARLKATFEAMRHADGAMTIQLDGDATGASLPAPEGGLLGRAFTLTAHVRRAVDGQMTVAAKVKGRAADAVLAAHLGRTTGHGTVTLQVPDLTKAHAGFGGSAMARIDLHTLTLAGKIRGQIRVAGRHIGASGLGRSLGRAPTVTAQIAAGNGRYQVTDLRVATSALTARGSLSLAKSGAVSVHVNVPHGDLGPLAPLLGHPMAGTFSLVADVHGTASKPIVRLQAAVPKLRVGKNVLQRVTLALNAHKAAGWSGAIRLAAATAVGPINLASSVDVRQNGWTVSVIHGALGPARLAGRIGMQGGAYSGQLTVRGNILKPVGLLLGQPASGDGRITLIGRGDRLHVAANIRHIALGALRNASLTSTATLHGVTGPLDLAVQIKDGKNALMARAEAKLKPLAVTLTALAGQWSGTHFRLRAPTSLTLKAGHFVLERSRLSVAGGEVVAAASGGGGQLLAQLQLASLPMSSLAAIMHAPKASGTLNGSLRVAFTNTSTHARFQLNARNVAFQAPGKKVKPADLTLAADWNGSHLNVEGRITGFSSKAVTLSLQAPVMRKTGSYMPDLVPTGALRGHLFASVDASRLMALLPLAEETAGGFVTADIRVAGNVAHPQFSGRLAIAHGHFSDLQTGTRLADLNAQLAAGAGSTVNLTLSATDGGSGSIKAHGAFSLAALQSGGLGHPTGRLSMTFNDAELIREDLVHGAVSGTLDLDLPADKPALITGKLHTNTVRVDIGAAIPPAIPTIKVQYVGEKPPSAGPHKPRAGKSSKPLFFSAAQLHIALNIPNRLYVSGHGLTSEWSGHLNISGSVAHPAYSGLLRVVTGNLDLIGKTFTLQTGLVRISNNLPGDAVVNIEAQNTSTSLSVTLTVTGPVTSPKISWSSVPSLPQSEILSNLLFGSGTPQLSIGQAFQLAQMSGALNSFGVGGGSGGGLLGFARNLTGLDVLSFSGPSNLQGSGASVTAGKYIGNRVYVGVTQGASTSATSAEVRVKVLPHITVTGTAGANNSNSLGINWRWHY